jgi:hypothetical protein
MKNALAASEISQDGFRTRARAGCGDATSLYKNLVKNRKSNFLRQAIQVQEPIFSVAHISYCVNTNFEG